MIYRKSGVPEVLRKVLRALDFILFFVFLSVKNKENLLSKRYVLIELGPGPLKLQGLKRYLFKKVYYLDHKDYADKTENFMLIDLENGIPQPNGIEMNCIPEVDHTNYIYFADHCLEHISFDVFENFLNGYKGSFLFRVPNIYSNAGNLDFLSDETHITEFNDVQSRVIDKRYSASKIFWTRFYDKSFLWSGFFSKEKSREAVLYRVVNRFNPN